jgi:valyl-tRNA synthetase
MSKSLGNSIDPLEIIEKFSADALRYSLIALTATGQDVYVSEDKFELGRNFGTKIWNAARFMQMHKTAEPIDVRALKLDPARWSADDWHIVAKADDAAKACEDCLSRYRFNDYAMVLYEFLWHEFCDWYVEYAKDVLYGTDEARRREVLQIMHFVFEKALRLLQPLMPFLTEELWHGMGYGAEDETIQRAAWPVAQDATLRGLADVHVAYVDRKHELIRAGRTLRADYEIPPARKVDFVLKPAEGIDAARVEADGRMIGQLMKAETFQVDAAFVPGQAMPSALTGMGTLYMSPGAGVDVAAERAKLAGQITQTREGLARVDAKLANPGFLAKAKPELVEQERARRTELADKIAKLEALSAALGPG